MKIGIISDTHGSEQRWALAYKKHFYNADLIIHAGDVLYHGPRNPMKEDYNPAGLAEKINQSAPPVLICRGNCDSEVDQLVLKTPIQAPYAYAFICGKRIVATHGHLIESEAAKDEAARTMCADVFITGHIHKNVLKKRGATIFLNPGSPSISKREDGKATIALMTDEKIVILDLDTDEVLLELAF